MENGEWSSIGISKPENDDYFHELHKNSNENNEINGHNIGNLEDIDQMFLNQLEQNLYESSAMNSHRDKNHTTDSPSGNDNTDININMISGSIQEVPGELGNHINFMVSDDLNLDASKSYNQSSAYPPTNLPTHTPKMVGNKNLNYSQNMANRIMASPILPGQNEKSYNDQHLYHKQNRSRSSISSYSVRPDAVFTPLVSPAGTPLDAQVNVNKSAGPVQATFEPLTSPALGAQRADDRRRSSSSTFGPSEEISSHSKRRTPHGTPILSANNKSKLTPSIKHMNSSRNVISFEKLPESSLNSSKSSVENTPMLPPQGKVIDVSSNKSDPPATLMGFTMGRLAEQKLDNGSNSTRGSAKSSRKSSVNHNNTRKIASKSSSEEEISPVLSTENDHYPTIAPKGKSEKPAAKKFSHKLAEQGRRNRMNMAVQELSNLIPKSYHDEVAIPSKATTVELASKYIEDLLQEIKNLRRAQ